MDGSQRYMGQTIGNYHVCSLLGTGGMGSVYLAERLDSLQFRVALKVLKGASDAHASQRFMRERQLLARLKHPNIARIIDSGETEDHCQWFAMELVEGLTLDAYLQKHALSLDEKIKLFRQVCDAVSYAHQNLIIHRDLKPGNIMVDAAGKPMLLDFGVAGLLDSAGGTQTQTMLGRAFTPQYASPEQMRGETLSAASDVYALGLIFYEMVTGARPYIVSPNSPQQAIEMICESPVTKPSDVVAEQNEAGTHLKGSLLGDLDTITLKALAKVPNERYQSVEQLSLDLDCYLADLPIYARPASVLYRTQKLIKRNALLVSILTTTFLLLVSALLYSVHLQIRTAEETIRTHRTKAFMGEMFTKIGPRLRTGSVDAARDILESSEIQIPFYFEDDIKSQVEILLYIMQSYQSMGYTEDVERLSLHMPTYLPLLKDQELRAELALAIIGMCRSQVCIDQSPSVFSQIKHWPIEQFNDDRLSQFFYVVGNLKMWTEDFRYTPDFTELENEIIRRNSLQPTIRLGILASRFDQPKDFIYQLAERARLTIRDQAVSCREIYAAVDNVSFLFGLIGLFEEELCIRHRYKEYLDSCVENSEGIYDLLRRRHEYNRSLLILEHYLKIESTNIHLYLSNESALEQSRFRSLSITDFYYSLITSYRKGDIDAASLLLERVMASFTLVEPSESWHEGYLIIGAGLYFQMLGEYEKSINILEDGLAWTEITKSHEMTMKTFLAKGYLQLERRTEALVLLDELRIHELDLGSVEKVKEWFWFEETQRLRESLEKGF